MIRICDYKELGTINDGLDMAAQTGSLTATLLGKAVDTEDSCGYETIPESVGIAWMLRNPEAFGEQIDDALAFYREHLDNYYIAAILRSKDLFELISEGERVRFMRDVIARHTTDGRWVRTVIEAGVPRADVAGAILDKLRATDVDLSKSGIDFLSYEFLEYGAGYISRSFFGLVFDDKYTLWSVLSDDEFIEALRICIDKAPNLLFGGPDINSRITLIQKLDLRLPRNQVDAILLEAAAKLQNLGHVSIDALDRLPFDVRLDITRRTGGPLDLVVRLALELGSENGGLALCDEFRESFALVNSDTYRRLHPLLRSTNDHTMVSVINPELVNALVSNGFIIGTVIWGTHYHRRTRSVREQLQVEWNRTTYVQSRYQHRYFPKEGDLVIINTKYGHSLAPRVVAVDFVLLQSAAM